MVILTHRISYLWKKHLPTAKQVPHNLHAIHQWSLNDVKWPSVSNYLGQALLCVLDDILLDALYAQRHTHTPQQRHIVRGRGHFK